MTEEYYGNFEQWCYLNTDNDEHRKFTRRATNDPLFPFEYEIYEEMLNHIRAHWSNKRSYDHALARAWQAYSHESQERRQSYNWFVHYRGSSDEDEQEFE